jgi:hypothetical protein
MLDTEEVSLLEQYQKCESFIDEGRTVGKVLIHW